MQVVEKTISIDELRIMSKKMFNGIVKAVIDIKKEILVVDAPMHSDQEEFLLDNGSDQEDLWGINFVPEHAGTDDFIEFDSMINLRPSWGNNSRSVDDPNIRKKIRAIVSKFVTL